MNPDKVMQHPGNEGVFNQNLECTLIHPEGCTVSHLLHGYLINKSKQAQMHKIINKNKI